MSLSFFDSLLKSEHNRLILWLPVGIAIGIGWYFSLKSEPDFFYLAFLLMIVISLFLFKNMRIMAFIASVVSIGFCAVWLKSSLLSTHQIKEEIGPLSFSGVIEKVDEKASALRLTISSLEFEDDHMPSLARVRLTCRGKKMLSLGLSPGQMVMLRAVLLPAQGPPHPYGYNFRRQAYFEGLSAVGYCTSLPKIIEESQNNHIISKLRYNLTKMLRNNIGGTPGEIAAALVTGDRSGIPDSIRQIYADSGIAHVLAISGLHLSLVD
jgi:competence protein ComEC